MTKGGKNLIILGVSATAIAFITMIVSLVIYHVSGDIYLDRSRPGYLPDETELEQEKEEKADYEFSKNGVIDKEALKEYLENLNKELEETNKIDDPFAPEPLNDNNFGI